MDQTRIKILAIEDSEIDIRVARSILREIPRYQFQLQHRRCLEEGIAALGSDHFDVVLLDLILPDCQGLESLAKLHAHVPQMPILVLTHMNDERGALQAVRCRVV